MPTATSWPLRVYAAQRTDHGIPWMGTLVHNSAPGFKAEPVGARASDATVRRYPPSDPRPSDHRSDPSPGAIESVSRDRRLPPRSPPPRSSSKSAIRSGSRGNQSLLARAASVPSPYQPARAQACPPALTGLRRQPADQQRPLRRQHHPATLPPRRPHLLRAQGHRRQVPPWGSQSPQATPRQPQHPAHVERRSTTPRATRRHPPLTRERPTLRRSDIDADPDAAEPVLSAAEARRRLALWG